MTTAEQARSRARDLLSRMEVKRVPTPLPKIARALKIEVEYTPLDDELSGMAFIKDGRRFAWINALHHPNRQRFSLAHEIAHHILHEDLLKQGVHVDKGILRRDKLSSQGTDDLEVQANAFASEFLMPTDHVEAALPPNFDLDNIEHINQLADRFRVSLAAMQYRLMRS